MKTNIAALTALSVALMACSGALTPVLAQVYQGTTTSADALVRVQLSVSDRLHGTEGAAFAYCVCKKNRGKIIYVYSYLDNAQRSLPDSCKEVASSSECGGCFKPPAVDVLRSSEYEAAVADDDRRRKIFSLFDSAAPGGTTRKRVLPNYTPSQ